MRIRAKLPGNSRRSRGVLVALSALALAACDSAPMDTPAEATLATVAQPTEGCLARVWQEQESPDPEFDRAHDQADGGSISCDLGTSASRLAATLADIRAAAAAGDRTALRRHLAVPLLHIDADGTRRQLSAGDLDGSMLDEILQPELMALLARGRLEDLAVVPDEGAFLELGAVWLAVRGGDGLPRIVTVNHQALAEAAAAEARRARE